MESQDPNFVVFTALLGDYDNLPRIEAHADIMYVCFTDRPREASGWTFVQISHFFVDPKLTVLYVKCNPHLWFDSSTTACWVDSTFDEIRIDRSSVIKWLGAADVATCRHQVRNTVGEEIEAVLALDLDFPSSVTKLSKLMCEESFPDQSGLAATMLVIYALDHPRVAEFCETWWSLILRTARRDQLTFNFASWSENIELKYLDLDYANKTQYLTPGRHKRSSAQIRTGLQLSDCRDSAGLGRFNYADMPRNYPAVSPCLIRKYNRQEATLIREINAIVQAHSLEMEGNYYHANKSRASRFLPRDPRRSGKRELLRQLSLNSRQVLEIGFNAGHSAVCMLTANDRLHYLGIDIGLHSYTQPTASFLSHRFPDRFRIAWGSSLSILSQLENETWQSFDLVHIDGGHDESTFRSDLECCIDRCLPDTVLVIDDAYATQIATTLDRYCAKGDLVPIHQEYTSEVSVYRIADA